MSNPLAIVALCITTAAMAQNLAAGEASGHGKAEEGIWKSAVPPKSMKGEFENHDPIGLAAGAWIKTDCSLNWIDPDDSKLYCFNSATSVEYFRSWPKANIRRAKARWEAGS